MKTLIIPSLRNARITSILFGAGAVIGVITFAYFCTRGMRQVSEEPSLTVAFMVLVFFEIAVIYFFRLNRFLIKGQSGWELTDRFRFAVVRRVTLGENLKIEIKQRKDRYFEVWLCSETGNVLVDSFPVRAQADQLAVYLKKGIEVQ